MCRRLFARAKIVTRANLTRACLTRACLTRAKLARATLTRGKLTRARFKRYLIHARADFARAMSTRGRIKDAATGMGHAVGELRTAGFLLRRLYRAGQGRGGLRPGRLRDRCDLRPLALRLLGTWPHRRPVAGGLLLDGLTLRGQVRRLYDRAFDLRPHGGRLFRPRRRVKDAGATMRHFTVAHTPMRKFRSAGFLLRRFRSGRGHGRGRGWGRKLPTLDNAALRGHEAVIAVLFMLTVLSNDFIPLRDRNFLKIISMSARECSRFLSRGCVSDPLFVQGRTDFRRCLWIFSRILFNNFIYLALKFRICILIFCIPGVVPLFGKFFPFRLHLIALFFLGALQLKFFGFMGFKSRLYIADDFGPRIMRFNFPESMRRGLLPLVQGRLPRPHAPLNFDKAGVSPGFVVPVALDDPFLILLRHPVIAPMLPGHRPGELPVFGIIGHLRGHGVAQRLCRFGIVCGVLVDYSIDFIV
ncbi:pentapeptide repeat-containing protein [Solidesulfovibrio alcoholivorans]|uniref:pentapeptide repeat-containing protein n=1 Tax=Solidesulfovibrio alcoholivorans TaxID=81406 RepID=UPI0004965277